MNTTANELHAAATARIATCNMYLGNNALVSHNTVVVSNITNGRGVHQRQVQGKQHMVVALFDKGMPTCYTPGDAADLAAQFNAQFRRAGSPERVRCVSAPTWWATELEAAQGILAALAHAA